MKRYITRVMLLNNHVLFLLLRYVCATESHLLPVTVRNRRASWDSWGATEKCWGHGLGGLIK